MSNNGLTGKQEFTSIYTGSEFFLNEHRLYNDKVLPGAAYLELARVAGELSTGAGVTGLRDVTWQRLLKVEDQATPVHVRVETSAAGIGYVVYTGHDGTTCIYGTGTIVTTPLSAPPAQEVEGIRHRLGGYLSATACYDIFSGLGLNYGNRFRGISDIYYSTTEVLTRIQLPVEEGYVLSPGLLDSALQSCIGFFTEGGAAGLSLPYSIREMNIYGPLPASLWCHVQKSGSGYNILVMDESGGVLVSMNDFVTLPYSGTETKVPAGSSYLYQPIWTAGDAAGETAGAKGEDLLLVSGGPATLAEKLGERLEMRAVH
ncbi:polyketide synthase dehydratase domain-containing protein, partial [Chitinophaga sp. 22536]|uniref:polyketide synthase dehydratase domain-containing protein n=1 Tax=Chitinophaga sp. 22536 TaxID=3453939 RepID=UPI003F85E527